MVISHVLILELLGSSLVSRVLMERGWMGGRVGRGIWLLLRRWVGLDGLWEGEDFGKELFYGYVGR